MNLSISLDYGNSFQVVAFSKHLNDEINYVINNVGDNIMINGVCTNSINDSIGFIGTVYYRRNKYSTTAPITEGLWRSKSLNGNDNNNNNTCFKYLSDSASYINNSNIANDARWIWYRNYNDNDDTLIFQFDFSIIYGNGNYNNNGSYKNTSISLDTPSTSIGIAVLYLSIHTYIHDGSY